MIAAFLSAERARACEEARLQVRGNDIVRRLVTPVRDRQERVALRERWWQFAEKRPGLYANIDGLDHVLVLALTSLLQQFLKLESAGGIVLCAAAALAVVLANSPLAALYERLLELPVAVQVDGLVIAKPLLLWVLTG